MFKAVLAGMALSLWAHALAPLDGLIKGDVSEIVQYDPLENLFSKQFFSADGKEQSFQRVKLEFYKGMFNQGAALVNTCDVERFHSYRDQWSEESAKRSIVANLQYLGLDVSSRAIVEYAKSFKLEDDEFKNIVDNLVTNTCSNNISVFSKKLLRDNFQRMWEGETKFKAPSLVDSPYVAKYNFDKTESFSAKEREFNFALKNFRDFCSWGGDVDNYRMLPPYLQNPFVMSLVFNHMTKRQLSWDADRTMAVLVPSADAVQVACEDLICRRREPPAFERMYPRMLGSVSLQDDLEVLYCNHFRDTSVKGADAPEVVKEWINAQGLEEAKISAMGFFALATGMPDYFFAVDTYDELAQMFSKTVEHRWDDWAKKQTDTLVLDLLYEESLFVDLAPVDASAKARGELGMTFDFTLGELDRELEVVDKISSTFKLVFPRSYLSWIRRSHIQASNRSQYAKMEELERKLATYVGLQLEQKAGYFDIPLWNSSFPRILARELTERLSSYQGSALDGFSQEEMVVPVKFRFGLFALKYLRDKYKAKYHNKP